MSRRVMQVLGRFTPTMEIYSIDECFLDLSGFRQDLSGYGRTIAKTVKQGTGIAGNHSVLTWDTLTEPDKLLSTIQVKELWGISSGLGKRLNKIEINNVLALKQANTQLIRKQFGVVVERIVRELNGIPCIPLELIPPKRKQILTSRSFGTRLSTLPELRAAVTVFATRSAEKLRAQDLCTQCLCVFIHTSPFDLNKPGYNNAFTLNWDVPTQDTGILIRHTLAGLERIYKPGYQFQRAGVLLPDLVPTDYRQFTLFDADDIKRQKSQLGYPLKSERLMAALDTINQHHGWHALRYASQGLSQRWHMRQQLKSPAYTTRWECLPKAVIS